MGTSHLRRADGSSGLGISRILLHGRRNDFRRHWWHHTAASQNMVGITTSAFYTPAFTLQLYASRSQEKLALFLCHIEILIAESD
jgi:predicted membrane-bound mannosyltransferase